MYSQHGLFVPSSLAGLLILSRKTVGDSTPFLSDPPASAALSSIQSSVVPHRHTHTHTHTISI